jgi:rhodanese-related sulfurtransferase
MVNRPKVSQPPRFFSFQNITCATIRNAWDIFVFSSFFAILFNIFYTYGIELKVKPHKIGQITGQPTPYVGWKTPTTKPSTTTTTETIPHLSLIGVKDRFDRKVALFLDARKPEEYKEGHIPGAINFSALEINKFAPIVLPQLKDKNQELIAYCIGGDCTLSTELAQMLIDQGYTRVEVYEGGWPEWKKTGYPVTVGDTP